MAGGRAARAQERAHAKAAKAASRQRAEEAAQVLEKLTNPGTRRSIAALSDAVQKGELLKTHLPALATAMPAARADLAALKDRKLQQTKSRLLTLVEQAQRQPGVDLSSYFSDLFDDGDADHNAALD